MKPFSPRMFHQVVTLHKVVRPTGGSGGSKPTWPGDGAELMASVQKSHVNRVDATGRTYTQTVHNVRTAQEPGAMAGVGAVTTGDRFTWKGHLLIAEGHAEPNGIGADVIWITQCLETR